MRKLLAILFFCITIPAHAQTFYTDLFGFRLGQYREALKTQLGKPFKSGKYDDGFEYEAFALKPDKSLYMICEYSTKDKEVIWSIQVSGKSLTTDVGFKNLRLGMDQTEAKVLLGKPSVIKDIGEYGHMWSYDKTNFSVEVDKSGKLSSIKILNNANELFPGAPDIKKIPSFDKVQKILNSNNNAEILTLLAGDLEVYYNKQTYYFKKSMLVEQTEDYSKVLSVIKTISKDLSTVNTFDESQYEENMRVSLGEDIKHVIKIKKDHTIKEIVLKYFGGRYYIFEINADSK